MQLPLGAHVFTLVCVRSCVCACVCVCVYTASLSAIDKAAAGHASTDKLTESTQDLKDQLESLQRDVQRLQEEADVARAAETEAHTQVGHTHTHTRARAREHAHRKMRWWSTYRKRDVHTAQIR